MYYPKSKIVENQHTSGGELTDPATGQSYSGFYHITYDGKYYTEASHSINSTQLISSISSPNTGSFGTLSHMPFISNFEYDTATNNKMSFLFSFEIPTPIYPQPTINDYQNGQFLRYFMQKVTDKKIVEISQQGYQVIQDNPMYVSTSFVWKLSGPLHDTRINQYNIVYGIADTNARTLDQNEKNMKGIKNYLSNLIELAHVQ